MKVKEFIVKLAVEDIRKIVADKLTNLNDSLELADIIYKEIIKSATYEDDIAGRVIAFLNQDKEKHSEKLEELMNEFTEWYDENELKEYSYIDALYNYDEVWVSAVKNLIGDDLMFNSYKLELTRRFDAVFYEVEEFINKNEIYDLMYRLPTNFQNLDITHVEGNNSISYGFISEHMAKQLSFNYDLLSKFVKNIMNDAKLETPNYYYEYKEAKLKFNIYIVRHFSDVL